MKKIIYLSGLPRSGSTLLSNVLAMHPNISSTPSSPLCHILEKMRGHWSDDPFLLAQLDDNWEVVHDRLKRSTMAFMQAWSDEHPSPIVINKNRGWLACAEWLRELDPNFKIIVTLRDLRDVYTSIEKRHRKTLFLNFPDNLHHNSADSRANNLFSDEGLIGSALKGIRNTSDIPDISQHIYYWRYEDFIETPHQVMDNLFNFLGEEKCEIDYDNLIQSTNESDSYYRMKYPHEISKTVHKPSGHLKEPISPRILKEIESRFLWYFEQFYSDRHTFEQEILNLSNSGTNPISKTQNDALQSCGEASEDTEMIAELERAIQKETSQ